MGSRIQGLDLDVNVAIARNKLSCSAAASLTMFFGGGLIGFYRVLRVPFKGYYIGLGLRVLFFRGLIFLRFWGRKTLL